MKRTQRITLIAVIIALLLVPLVSRYAAAASNPVAATVEEAVILTPKPGPTPRINGPKVYGCGPSHPFLYRIPCTGVRPMIFATEGLPSSLKLDSMTGIITGTVPERGEYRVTFTAKNQFGRSERVMKIVAGDRLSLTPQMGFNDWYAYYNRVTDLDMRTAADIMIAKGMADAGYQYVNIDDCWMGKRDAAGNITGNKKFPNMKALADYIHSKGLKAGIYTSPGPRTCAGYPGAWRHEAQDAKQFAEWGFDFLKYDWCSYGEVAGGKDLAALQKPYRLMSKLLKQQNRDIVLNLCQYGMGDVWNWGGDVGGHSWRTGGDLGFELNRIFEVALKNCALRKHNKPGEWNDPDYIQIGWIGNANAMGKARPAPLTPNESYSFMSLWCLMAAPLFYSGDMTKLDDFALNVLCNPELIDVDQDPLGECAQTVGDVSNTLVLVKNLEDGTKAVGLFNRGDFVVPVTVKWSDLGLAGKQQNVRDLWRQKDLGGFENQFSAPIGRHGAMMLRIRQ
ncbi:MAG: putative Ig domain-containing protein [Planctomycetota bacterium]